MKNQLDLTQDSVYDIVINANSTLDVIIEAVILSGSTEVPFVFDDYYAGALVVKDRSKEILNLNTDNGGLTLLPEGKFRLFGIAEDLNIRAGEYSYNLFITSIDFPVRQFISGKFIIQSVIKPA